MGSEIPRYDTGMPGCIVCVEDRTVLIGLTDVLMMVITFQQPFCLCLSTRGVLFPKLRK